MDLSSEVGLPLLLASRNKENLLLFPLLNCDVNLLQKGSSTWGSAGKRAARLNSVGVIYTITLGQSLTGG